MGENWFQREFMAPRRLAFNVFFYGLHVGLFAYGWYSQVSIYLDLSQGGI
jgi:NADPH oxidase